MSKSLILRWMEGHAIDPHLAHRIGLRGDGTTLRVPYRTRAGSTFHRTRRFPDGDFMQPAGIPLCLWWPLGRAYGSSVLLLEGESDALCAASILDTCEHPTLNGLCPASMPGVGAVKVAVAELATQRIKHCYIALDGDTPGRRATEKLCDHLLRVGIIPFPISLPTGKDLSDVIMGVGAEALRAYVSSATPRTHVRTQMPSQPVRSHWVASDDPLRRIPAPTYVSALAEIPEPAVGALINCPLHEDRTPSFRVNDEGLFICYGCGAAGSIFDFSMQLWGCGFLEARERLSDLFGQERISTPPPEPQLVSAPEESPPATTAPSSASSSTRHTRRWHGTESVTTHRS